MSYTVGYAATVSKQILRFNQLINIANDTQLTALAINHSNAVVRLYAYQALKQKVTAIPQDVISHLINDHTVVETLWGCFGGSKAISSLAKEDLKFNEFQRNLKIKKKE